MLPIAARFRRSLVLSLLTALLYQAGACPCGCWDESIWRYLVVGSTAWLDATERLQSGTVLASLDGAGIAPLATDACEPMNMSATDDHECGALAKMTRRDGDRDRRDVNASIVSWRS
jgi:hypothetical protein